MMRAVAAVFLGFLAMNFWVFFSVSMAWKYLGVSFAFKAESWEVSTAWIALNLPLSFIGASMGGFATSLVAQARSSSAVKTLATMILLVGLVMALARTMAEEPPVPPAGTYPTDVEIAEIAKYERQPPWYNAVIPIIGAVGILAGGKLGERRQLRMMMLKMNEPEA